MDLASIDLKDHVRTIPDFPKPGIQFRDVTTLFGHPHAFAACVERIADRVAALEPDLIAGIEARGFALGGALATRLGAGFVMLRKKGKLPHHTIEEAYALEYGQAVIEVHRDAAGGGSKVVIVDDLIATGGTGVAAINLIKRLGAAPLAFAAVIDLPELGGAAKIAATGVTVETLIAYEGH